MSKSNEYGVKDIVQNRMVLGECVARSARKFSGKIAIVYGERRITYQEFNERCNALAWALKDKGVEQGDNVAVYLQNCNEMLELWIALNKLGAVFCGINYFLAKKDELVPVIKNSDCKGIIYGEEFKERIIPCVGDLPDVKFAIIVGENRCDEWGASYDDLIQRYSKDEVPRECCPAENSISALLYTAGTTSPLPKGVVHTHKSILSNIMNIATVYGLNSDDTLALVTPLFHCSSAAVALSALWLGGKVVIMRPNVPDVFRESQLKLIEKEKITFLWQISTLWQMLLSTPQVERDKYDVSTLRIMVGGGAYTPIPVRKELMSWFFNAEFSEMYGLTENFGPCLYIPLGYSLKKPDSVGVPEPNVETRIVDDRGNDLVMEECGELLIRGPIVTPGYYRNPDANREAYTDNGWFHTGDFLSQDNDGYFYFIDRKKDIVVSGGENVSSIEVESVVKSHPKVADVAVIPVSDEKWGDRVHACIVLKPGINENKEDLNEEILAYCREKLSGFKVPKSISYEESLPYSPSMKLLKNRLREKYRNGQID